MSKFDAATKKVQPAAPKPKAKAGTAATAAPKPVDAKKPTFKTLDEKKKWVRAHENKIDDVEYDNYGNRIKKKEINSMYDNDYWNGKKTKKKDGKLLNARLEKR